MNQTLKITHRNQLPRGGFAGIVETRMVLSPKFSASASTQKDISHGLGDFIYLATGHFKPNDGAHLHPHNDVDIVSVILNGAIGHKGSLGDGTIIEGPGVQVQRAGSGMEHAEFSVTDEKADFVQLWFLPPEKSLQPAYQNFSLQEGELTTVLGGQNNSFHSTMQCQVGYLKKGQTLSINEPFIVFITEGQASANGTLVKTGDLIEGDNLTLTSDQAFGLILIHHTGAES